MLRRFVFLAATGLLILAGASGSPAAAGKRWQLIVLWPDSWDADYRDTYPNQAKCNRAKPDVSAALFERAEQDGTRRLLKNTLLVCLEAYRPSKDAMSH
jgi:hypothetical protein